MTVFFRAQPPARRAESSGILAESLEALIRELAPVLQAVLPPLLDAGPWLLVAALEADPSTVAGLLAAARGIRDYESVVAARSAR